MNKNDTIDLRAMEDEFYSKPFKFSYSSLNKLMNNPRDFYNEYVLLLKEELLDRHIIRGKLIHCLLLERKNFNNLFIQSPMKLPGETVKKLIDELYKKLQLKGDRIPDLHMCHVEILQYMKDTDYHQSLKTDTQRLDKIVTEEGKNYWAFLQEAKGKNVIDQDMMNECMEAATIMKYHSTVGPLLGFSTTDFDDGTILYEVPVQINKLQDFDFGLKGIIDNLRVTLSTKKIQINDIKTTSKTLSEWKESVEFYRYWLQAAIYHTLATEYAISNGITPEELIDWDIEITFVVIDRDKQVYPFVVTEETMQNWLKEMKYALDIGSYHYNSRKYKLPYAFCTGQVKL